MLNLRLLVPVLLGLALALCLLCLASGIVFVVFGLVALCSLCLAWWRCVVFDVFGGVLFGLVALCLLWLAS